MSLKKIALIIPGGLGTGKNNIGVPVLEQIVQLLSHQFDITVFQLYKVNHGYKPNGFRLFGFTSENKLGQYFRFAFAFYRENKKNNFEAIHGFWVWPCGFLAVALGGIFKIKSVVSVLGGDASSLPEIKYGHLRKRVSRKMILWSLEKSDEATALTSYLAKNLYQVGLRRKLKIIPWGVDQHLFTFRDRILQNPIQFLHIANLNPLKDQRTLLYAFKIINQSVPSRLTIIGEGTEEKNIISLIDRLSLQDVVTIHSQLPYEQLPYFYHRSDFLLHTSRSEGQSEVVTEAISSGVLVAGTEVGLIHDCPEFCISVKVGDYESLAKKVLSLLKDVDRMKDLREKAHTWTADHAIQWTVSMISQLYLSK